MRVAGRLLLHAGWWAFVIYAAFWVTELFYGSSCFGSTWVQPPATVSFNKIDGKLGFYLFMMWPIVLAVGSQLYSYYRREWPWLPASAQLSW